MLFFNISFPSMDRLRDHKLLTEYISCQVQLFIKTPFLQVPLSNLYDS